MTNFYPLHFKTKLHLYRVFILQIMLCGSECWAINKADIQQIRGSVPMVPTKNPGHSLARLSEMPTSVALPTSHHFHPSLSPVVSLSLGILHEWMRMQVLAKPSLNFFQRTGGDHHGSCGQLGWRTFMMTCLHWILGYMRLEIWHKIGFSGDWCLYTVLRTCSGLFRDA